MPVVPSPVATYIESGLEAALGGGADDETTALVKSVDRMLTHADLRRRLAIRANADTAEDAERARSLGAQGIGLCRTEHMFLGDRRSLIERVILAGSAQQRDAALDALLPLQRKDFTELLTAMDGLPVNIRLLDPPLHEFLPDRTELSVRVAVAEALGESGPKVDADARSAWGAPRAAHPWAVRPAGAGHRRGGQRSSRRGEASAGGDHGAAGRFGDGTAPGP
jgi:pyruvate,orthophosphate dikinase